MKGPVTQTWTHNLTFMQQTVLLTAVRGPDGMPKYGPIKMLLRWYRRCILRIALEGGRVILDPVDQGGGSFTGPSITAIDLSHSTTLHRAEWEGPMNNLVGEYLRLFDALPIHFQMHFMHGVEILGYKHPNDQIRTWWNEVYHRLVGYMHLRAEFEDAMDKRLGDNHDAWLASSDPATSA